VCLSPSTLLLAPLKAISKGFFVLFHISIWSSSTIHPHLTLLKLKFSVFITYLFYQVPVEECWSLQCIALSISLSSSVSCSHVFWHFVRSINTLDLLLLYGEILIPCSYVLSVISIDAPDFIWLIFTWYFKSKTVKLACHEFYRCWQYTGDSFVYTFCIFNKEEYGHSYRPDTTLKCSRIFWASCGCSKSFRFSD
jgi:hypothetical protein